MPIDTVNSTCIDKVNDLKTVYVLIIKEILGQPNVGNSFDFCNREERIRLDIMDY
jgi:hypothetical protein